FEEAGVRTIICDPRLLEYRRGRLYAEGKPVNLVYRRVLTSELIAHGDDTRALREAYVAGTACVVNSFRAQLLHKKVSLAVDLDPYLFDGRAGGFMTRVSAAALLNVTAGAGSVVPTFVVEEAA